MLVVDPGSDMVPVKVSFTVFTTSTRLVNESKASRVALSGDIAIKPGELPALIPPRPMVSLVPLMMIRPEEAVGVEALCEAKTRSGRPLVGAVPAFFE